MDTPVLDATCAACAASLEGKPNQCVTDCGHVFCVACVCRQLGHQKNRCSYCQSVVKLVRQLDPLGQDASREKPCSVKFANTTYILYVSIWSVHDPTATLAELFHLEKSARLIHQGKVLKKGDVWPGAVVQLVGTRKTLDATPASASSRFSSLWEASVASLVWLLLLLTTPFRYLYLFFHSMVAGHAYTSLPTQRYAPVEPAPPTAPTFQPLGRAAAPTETDHV